MNAQPAGDSRAGGHAASRQPPAEPERNPFDLMTQQPFLGERPMLEGGHSAPSSEGAHHSSCQIDHFSSALHTWRRLCRKDV